MTRTIFIFFLAILISACGSAENAPPAASAATFAPLVLTPTPVIPTPTETPNIPTSTPDALAGVNYRDPTTYPAEVQTYWQTGIWPPYEKQVELSNTFFQPLYKGVLQDTGWTQEKINELTPFQLYTSANKVANEQGYVIPADLDLTRQMAASPQMIGDYGILSGFNIPNDIIDRGINGYNYDLTVFGSNITIHHAPSGTILTQEAMLAQTGQNKYILIAHYFSTSPIDGKKTEHFKPVSIYFNEISINKKVQSNFSTNSDNFSVVNIDPVIIKGVLDESAGFANLNYYKNFEVFFQVLRNADNCILIDLSGQGVSLDPTLISNDGLEIATGVIIPQKPAATPSPAAPTPTP
jgi:hypothetical protein